MRKEWLEWKSFDTSEEKVPNIPAEAGIYVFATIEKFELNIDEFNLEVTGEFVKNKEKYSKIVGTPPCNKSEKIFTINEEEVFYVGTAKNLRNRIQTHMNDSEINNTVSLKLGFESRRFVKKFLRVYYKEREDIEECRKLEGTIRKRDNAIFGK